MIKTLILDVLGICQHTRYTFPVSDRKTGLTTVVCTDCGRRFEYDWDAMERGREVKEPAGQTWQERDGRRIAPRKSVDPALLPARVRSVLRCGAEVQR
jgi:hypothetical protein